MTPVLCLIAWLALVLLAANLIGPIFCAWLTKLNTPPQVG
jgi:uncharacterized Tic20 family protein